MITKWCLALLAACAVSSGPQESAAAAEPGRVWTRVEGGATFRATEARFEWVLASTGEFRRTITGPLSEVTVFDGERVWRSEDGGPAYELELYARERALLEAAVWSGTWRAVRAGGADSALRLPGGVLQAPIELHPGARDVALLVVPANRAGHRLEFQGWSDGPGGRWPRRAVERTEEGMETVFEVDAVTPFTGDPAGVLRLPVARSPATFDSALPAAIEVRRARTGHLFVRPTVNGEDVGWFLFDSGAGGTFLSPAVAERLELEAFGEERLTPFGPQVFEARLRRVASIALGRLEIRDLVVLDRVGPDMASRILGEPVAGVLGWDVFIRSVVTIDPRRPAIAIEDPASFALDGAEWHPLALHWKVPYVTARFEGDRAGLFCLDTGAGAGGVLFHAAAVERLGLLAGRETVAVTGGGPGGDVAMRRGELDWFELGGGRQRAVPATFSTGDDGENDPYTLGFLGAGILGQVDVVYDYGRRRVAFVPDEPR